MISLALGVCFCHSVSAKSTYVDYDGAKIQWDIVDADPSLGGKQLNIYGDLKMFSKFGNTIREKCEKESIDLKSVFVSNGLGYFVMPNKTLWIQPTPKCSDPNIKYCMIEALNLDSSGKRAVRGLTFKDSPVVPEYITFNEKEGKFYASSPWLTQRSETYKAYDAKSREKAVSKKAPAAVREEKVVVHRDTRKQEIEELTEKRADLKSRLTQVKKSLITYQGEIVRCERLEREKGRLLQGTLDARESETKAKKHILTLESAIERIEEKLAALRI